MPWEERDVVEQRRDLIAAIEAGSSIAEAARRIGVSRKTASNWWHRHLDDGDVGLVDRSRARLTRPEWETPPPMVALVVSMRDRFPTWGGRKIRALLLREGHVGVPAASTITAILRREGRVHPAVRPKANWKGRLITAGHAFTALPVYIDEHEDNSITISYYNTIVRTLKPGRNL